MREESGEGRYPSGWFLVVFVGFVLWWRGVLWWLDSWLPGSFVVFELMVGEFAWEFRSQATEILRWYSLFCGAGRLPDVCPSPLVVVVCRGLVVLLAVRRLALSWFALFLCFFVACVCF
ncbi:unnamed protein product [Polarella glacialis]|uniref:Transmembrane protein n=1 Tax=Polarella glacialis TaxID=89957 RepID=A0A813F1G6_POLGL|nr:unnamed protein product [Polarella glacialis]